MAGAPLVVVMGVSGAGKTTVGERLAESLGVPYAEADEFHPPANIAKMAAGTPLTDEDRGPWLEAIGRWLAQHAEAGAVATCSALKRSYRDAVRAQASDVWFLHLEGDRGVIQQRVAHRPHHFMPVSLLDSQFETLEPPAEDERAFAIDADRLPDEIVAAFIAHLTPEHPGDSKI